MHLYRMLDLKGKKQEGPPKGENPPEAPHRHLLVPPPSHFTVRKVDGKVEKFL